MELKDMLAQGATLDQVVHHLEGLTDGRRVEALFSLGRRQQRALFRLAEGAPPLSFDHFVPPGVGVGRQVRHRGRNSLPLPGKHRRFEKRFCRPGDGSARLFGYNQCPSTRTVGPGYFVALATAGEPSWEPRGAIVVDYFQVPPADAPVPPGWPPIVPNQKGLSRFVYHGTRDFMRRVCRDVSIGAAYKGEKPLDHYFVLVREPLGAGENQVKALG